MTTNFTEDLEEKMEEDRKYFEWRSSKSSLFCSRFAEGIDFKGKRVLDLGSGHGALCFYAAENGAESVVGVDISSRLIQFSNIIKEEKYSQYNDVIQFKELDVKDLNDEPFDIILSYSSFEHLLQPQDVLNEMKARLKPGGKVFIGFTGLYNSPWGDHKRTEVPFNKIFPWAHLCFKKEWIIKNYNNKNPIKKINSIFDLGMNGFSFRQYLDLFYSCDLQITYFKVNKTKNPIVYIINLLRLIPGFRELLSINIYTILLKDNHEV